MKEEIESMEKNKTQELVDLLKEKFPILAKQIYKTKISPLDEILKLKGRIIIKRNELIKRLDYFDTFALIMCQSTICIVTSLAIQKQWCIRQIDVKITFLNNTLEKEVFIEVLEGFYGVRAQKVCKLWKVMYRLC